MSFGLRALPVGLGVRVFHGLWADARPVAFVLALSATISSVSTAYITGMRAAGAAGAIARTRARAAVLAIGLVVGATVIWSATGAAAGSASRTS